MSEEIKVQPPHPIPCPENPIIRTFYQTPKLLYRWDWVR